MIHARSDYNRFQEPKELLEFISELLGCIQVCIPKDTDKLAPGTHDAYEKRLGELNAKYHPINMGTPFAEDEPVILFRAKDSLFVEVLDNYREAIFDCVENGEDCKLIMDQLAKHIVLAADWRLANEEKVREPNSVI